MYEDHKIKVVEYKQKVRIVNRVSCETVVFDRDVFLTMCKGVMAQEAEKSKVKTKKETVK